MANKDIKTDLTLKGDLDMDGHSIDNVLSLGFTDATELTIDTGAITRTQSYHTIDTAADAATDDLDTISGGAAGDILYIRAANTARTVVIKHGTGNIVIPGGSDYSLDTADKTVVFLHDGTNWRLLVLESMVTNAKARVTLSANQTIATGTATLVAFDTETYDPGSNFNTTTHRFTAPISGDYLISAQIIWVAAGVVDGKRTGIYLYRNAGQTTARWLLSGAGGALFGNSAVDILSFAAGDYLEVKVEHQYGANADIQSSTAYSYIEIHLLSIV